MAPIVWLALLLGYLAGLGAAVVLLPGPVIEPLYGVLGLVTLLVVGATAGVLVARGRRSGARSAKPGHAAPDHEPEPDASVPPQGDPADPGSSPPDRSEADDPHAGDRPRSQISYEHPATGGRRWAKDADAARPALGEVPGERIAAARPAAAEDPDAARLPRGEIPADRGSIHERPDLAEGASRPEGWHGGSALPATPSPVGLPLGAGELRGLLLDGRVDALLRPLLGWPQRRVDLYHAVPRLRGRNGAPLGAARYLTTARRAGLTGLFEAILVLRTAQLIWEAGAEGRELCVVAPVTPFSLGDPSFVAQLERLVASHPDLPARLMLELDQLRLSAPAAQGQARLRRLGWRFCLRRIGPPVFELAALAARGFSFLRLEAPRFAGTAALDAAPAELRAIQKRLSDQGITLLVDRQDAGLTLAALADRPLVLDHDLLLEETRQSAA